jgi:imidazolonepropionase
MKPMKHLIIRHARALTMGGKPGVQRGAALGTLGVIGDAWMYVKDGVIADFGPEHLGPPPTDAGAMVVEAHGRVVMPGFVDCHTHACWAGDRLDEWDQKRAGVPYLEILKGGGGIMSTVRAVRAAAPRELQKTVERRVWALAGEGTTTVEVKTGYGLSPTAEPKMLAAIGAASSGSDHVMPTALLGHAIDPDVERSAFIASMVGPALDACAAARPGICVDAFCETGAWTLEECAELFTRATSLGCPFRVHADQFNALGMTEWAVDHGAISVDHLEASTEAGLRKLAGSDTFGVMLPACGFHLDGRYAKGRAFVDMGGALALATNLNPGSAPCFSMPFIIALAVRHLGLTPAEAIAATTINPAALLGLPDRGWIGLGARADLIVLRHTDERNLAFEFGGNHVHEVIHGGTPLIRTKLLDP